MAIVTVNSIILKKCLALAIQAGLVAMIDGSPGIGKSAVVHEIADEYGDRLKIVKLDIDANQETPPKYGIRGIPTLMLFKGGEVEATKVGALSKSQLAAFLDSNI